MSVQKMMRKIVLAGAAIAAASVSMNAADLQSDKISIPFPFQVQSKRLPAGEYRVDRSFGTRLAYLVNVRTGETVHVMAPSNSEYGKMKLSFEPNGGRYALTSSECGAGARFPRRAEAVW